MIIIRPSLIHRLLLSLILLLTVRLSYSQPFLQGKTFNIRLYSTSVKDSFSVFVRLPKQYTEEQKRRFTTIYLLDANLYFDIVAEIVTKYNDIGIMPPVILVGIGYNNFEEMEMMRTRDLLYPKAPGKDFKTSGGGENFLSFIKAELIPSIDESYRTKPDNRILMGHSFGGYFCLYALLKNLSQQDDTFRSYIAASPSLQYNNQYLLQQLKVANTDFKVPKLVYTSMGSLEDNEDGKQKEFISSMFSSFNNVVKEKKFKNILYQGDVYSNFYHMETAIATFTKGLLFIYRDHP